VLIESRYSGRRGKKKMGKKLAAGIGLLLIGGLHCCLNGGAK